MSMAYSHARAGRRSEALQLVDQMTEAAEQQYVPAAFFTVVFAGLGELDRAFEWLQKAYEQRSVLLVWLAVEPYLENLHGDPRFDAWIDKMHLSPTRSGDGTTLPGSP